LGRSVGTGPPHEPRDYLGWVEQQPSGKFERIDGVVVAMGP